MITKKEQEMLEDIKTEVRNNLRKKRITLGELAIHNLAMKAMKEIKKDED